MHLRLHSIPIGRSRHSISSNHDIDPGTGGAAGALAPPTLEPGGRRPSNIDTRIIFYFSLRYVLFHTLRPTWSTKAISLSLWRASAILYHVCSWCMISKWRACDQENASFCYCRSKRQKRVQGLERRHLRARYGFCLLLPRRKCLRKGHLMTLGQYL